MTPVMILSSCCSVIYFSGCLCIKHSDYLQLMISWRTSSTTWRTPWLNAWSITCVTWLLHIVFFYRHTFKGSKAFVFHFLLFRYRCDVEVSFAPAYLLHKSVMELFPNGISDKTCSYMTMPTFVGFPQMF